MDLRQRMDTLRSLMGGVFDKISDVGGMVNGGGTMFAHWRPRAQPEIELLVAGLIHQPSPTAPAAATEDLGKLKVRLGFLVGRVRNATVADLVFLPKDTFSQKFWVDAQRGYATAVDDLLKFVDTLPGWQAVEVLGLAYRGPFLERFATTRTAARGVITSATLNPPGTLAALTLVGVRRLVRSTSGESFIGGPTRVELRDPRIGKLVRMLSFPKSSLAEWNNGSMAFSPSGHSLAVGLLDGTLVTFDVATGRTIMLLRVSANPARANVVSLAWRTDGKQLAASVPRAGAVQVRNAATGALTTTLKLASGGNGVVAWKPDGTALAVSGGSHQLHIYALPTGREAYAVPTPVVSALV